MSSAIGCLLQIIVLHYGQITYRSKQHGPRTGATLFAIGFLNISADEKKQMIFVAIGALRVNSGTE